MSASLKPVTVPDGRVRLIEGDCRDVLRTLPDESVHCVVTSPPYFRLRDYGVNGQIGLEPTPDDYVAEMVAVFREVRRVLRSDGTLWLNLGDSYAGSGRGGNPAESQHRKQATNTGKPVWRKDNPDKNKGFSNRDGIGWVNGLKPKDLIGIPWRVAFALQADGWWLRQDIIWSKPNPMPESVTDRCTKAHEYLFLLTKAERYFFDAGAIAEPFADERFGASGVRPGVRQKYAESATRGGDQGLEKFNGSGRAGRNKRSVWTVNSHPFPDAHFATFPPALIEPCIKAGCPEGGTVLDPFGGAGTTGLVADRLGRNAILIELNPEYAAMAVRRIKGDAPLFAGGITTDHSPKQEALAI